MNRHDKEREIESLRSDFKESSAAFLVGVKGLTVAQLQQLRRGLDAEGGKLRLAKNTLAKIAATDFAEMHDLKPFFKNQLALVFAKGEAPAVANVLWKTAQTNKAVEIVAGCFESRVIEKEMIEFLATLPPRSVLLSQLCGTLNAPITQNVSVLHQVLSRFVSVLKQASEKDQQS